MPHPHPADLGERPELPGPLAVTLSHRTLRLVEAEEYMVCEKSDGERVMLLAVPAPHGGVPGPAAYLINRSFEVLTFDGAAAYAEILCGRSANGAGGPTLLDGELIQRADDAGTGTGARAVYMVFDAITVHGGPVGRSPLDARLHAIGNAVRTPFKVADERLAQEGRPSLPLYLLGKYFMPKSAIGAVFACIHQPPPAAVAGGGHGGGGAGPLTAPLESELQGAASGGPSSSHGRVYRHDIRVNGTDGVVLTPVRASYTDLFTSGRQSCRLPLLKWKFADENTVDFRLKRGDLEGGDAEGTSSASSGSSDGDRVLQLFLSTGRDKRGNEHDVAVARCRTSHEAADAYLALLDRLGVDSLIVEASYDVEASTWRLRRVRDRKTRANHITTGWQTMEVAAEHITAGELVARLSPPPSAAQLARPQHQQQQQQLRTAPPGAGVGANGSVAAR
jgi:hypothetical protein